MLRTSLLLILSAFTTFAQPVVNAVLDGAAYTPNIAQGSVFVVKGTNLSPAGLATAAAPSYPTTLNTVGISLTPTGGAPAISARLVYTYNQSGVNQLAAVLPSTVPTGSYDLRVTTGTAVSAPFRTAVVARKPGIVTVSGDGAGAVQATLDGKFILQRNTNQGRIGDFDTRPARPGERIDLWGTGLGPDTASDNGGTSGDQTAAAQIRVLINGTEVTPLYAGRSQGYPGLDQIVFTLPSTAALNCQVMIQVRTGAILSNPVTIATSNSDACPAATTIRINEVESNGGTPGDWVELYNVGTTPINLAGYIFKDNDNSRTFALPATAIVAPGGYLLLEEADFNFGLGAADSARLYRPDGTLADSYEWTAHAAITYGRCPNGTGPLTPNSTSTKGTANNCGSPIRINEVESDGGTPSDWVELINPSASPVDVSGYIVRNSTDTNSHTIPANTTIPASGYLVIEQITLNAADTARLFDNTSTLIDSYSWTTHATSTYGRCPNGTGAFTNTSSSTKGTVNACPGDVSFLAWPGSREISVVDPPATFNGNLSGLAFAPDSTLWAVRNGPGSVFRLRLDAGLWRPDPSATKALRYPTGTGDADAEGVTIVNGLLYIATERDNANNSVSRNSILRVDPAAPGATLTANMEWNLTADLPPVGPNVGLEGITFVPDSYLTSRNFIDESKNRAYNPADYPDHGTGLFFVGLEANGTIYAYALNQTNGTFTRIATISTGLAGVMDLHFDLTLNDLWAVCDNTCDGRMIVLRIDATNKFSPALRYERPALMPNLNNEGFTIGQCSAGQRLAFWADDSETGGNAIRTATLPCSALP